MRTAFLHILACLLPFLLGGCSKDVPAGENRADERIVNLSVGITTRADADKPSVLYLWIFDGSEGAGSECLYFQKMVDPEFSGVDLEGNPVQPVDVQLLTTNGTTLKFCVVLNDAMKPDEPSQPIEFNKSTPLTTLEELQFALSTYKNDNRVPMSGTAEQLITSTSNDYRIEIPAERAVAKLELFVTKNLPGSSLQITGISLSNIPATGSLFRNEEKFEPVIDTGKSVPLFAGTVGITASLTEADAPGSEDLYLFEGDNGKVQNIPLTNPYLLENPWGDGGIYLDENGSASITDTDSRYFLTFSYTLDGSSVEKKIYLTEIERNTLNKVFIRIKEKVFDIDVSYSVKDWVMEVLTPEF